MWSPLRHPGGVAANGSAGTVKGKSVVCMMVLPDAGIRRLALMSCADR